MATSIVKCLRNAISSSGLSPVVKCASDLAYMPEQPPVQGKTGVTK